MTVLSLEEQRNRTVLTFSRFPAEPLNEEDIANIKKRDQCLNETYRVWFDSNGVMGERSRLFVSITPDERRRRTKTLGRGISIPTSELIRHVKKCLG